MLCVKYVKNLAASRCRRICGVGQGSLSGETLRVGVVRIVRGILGGQALYICAWYNFVRMQKVGNNLKRCKMKRMRPQGPAFVYDRVLLLYLCVVRVVRGIWGGGGGAELTICVCQRLVGYERIVRKICRGLKLLQLYLEELRKNIFGFWRRPRPIH